MPVYEYHCASNGRTVELSHTLDASLRYWGEVCYVAQIPLGDTDPLAPVRRILTSAPAVSIPTGNTDYKAAGFTKLVKRDQGVYENVTATGDEKRYVVHGDPSSLPHLRDKVGD